MNFMPLDMDSYIIKIVTVDSHRLRLAHFLAVIILCMLSPLALSATSLGTTTLTTTTLTTTALTATAFGTKVFGLYYGGIAILGIYNIFFYLINKSKDILIYLACLSSILCYQLIVDGYISLNSPAFDQLQSPTIFLMILFFCQYGREFLHLRKKWPLADLMLRILSYASVSLFCLSWFLPVKLMSILSATMGLTACSILITSGFVALIKRGFYPAQYFVTAWVMFIAGGFSIIANNLADTPQMALIQFGGHFGGLLGALFLSFALADRMNRITRDNERVEHKAKTELEAANQSLTDNAIALRETLEELKKSNRLKDDFLLSINHELRTPINGIQGSLNLLKETEIGTQQSEYVRIAESSTGNLLTLIDSILELNSLNQNMVTIREDETNLFELLDRCVKAIREPCESKDISIDTISLTMPEIVFSDRVRLEHVIMNLLNNAVKFTERGSISLSSLIHKHNDDIYDFELLIKDTGIGIDPNKLNAVFDSFIQADTGYTRKHGGMGVGLSICKLIIEKMNGKIFAASMPGKGSTFIIRLPLKSPPNVTIKSFNSKADQPVERIPTIKRQNKATLKEATVAVEVSKGPIKVLIVEDLPVNQVLLKKALESLGMLPTLAANGQEALDLIQQMSFHIILMDCQMPVMDGFEATRQIRQLESKGMLSEQHIPIIAVTANALLGDERKCLDAGMDSYIAKPYQISRLEETIMSHIRFTQAKEVGE